MKKLLFLVTIFLLISMGNAQEVGNQYTVENIDSEVTAPDFNNSRAMWDLAFWFDLPGTYHGGIATDGIHFYTALITGGEFYRYDMDGSNPVQFTIPGVSKISGMTYDGEYFYAVNNEVNFVFKLDLANETYVGGFPAAHPGFWGAPQCIAYDPNLDNGNGGFWISEFFNLGAISMTGTSLINAISLGWDVIQGMAYDPYTDPQNPCLWLFTGPGGAASIFQQWDINTMAYTGVSHNCHPDNPYFGSTLYSAGRGCFPYNNGEGKFLIASVIMTSSPSLVMVYELCDVALPIAPGPVTNLTVTPGATGVLNAEIAWTNPVLTEEGGILIQLSAIKIYGNDILIHTISNPEIGGSETYTVSVTQAGEYTYRVVAENSFGASMPSIVVSWIGHDVPAAPENVTLVKNGQTAELSWLAVTTGLHEGYFTLEGIIYDIFRYPGAVAVASNLTESIFSESIESLQGYYFYRVVAKNDFGNGGYTDSKTGVFCDVQTLPYFESFENNGTHFPICWEQEFVEQNTLWEVKKDIPTIDGEYVAEMRIHIINTEITKLITPPLDLSGAGNYVLSFWSAPRGATAPFDILRVFYKTSADGEWILLDEFAPQFYSWDIIQNWKKRTYALPNGTAEYFIAFEAEIFHIGVWIDAISVFDAQIITGTVTDGTDPIEGAKVELIGTELFAFTDVDGKYDILDVGLGDYNLKATKLGYYDQTESITVSQSITVKDFALTPIPVFSVSGQITGSDAPDGLAGVTVSLSGYTTFSTTTDAAGNYSLPSVYGDNNYNIEARKTGYVTYRSAITMTNSNVTRDIDLLESASPVLHPKAVNNVGGVDIIWGQPIFGTAEAFRFDSGIADGQFGYSGSPVPRGVMGSCHRVNTAIEKVQWFLTNEAPEPATHVNIYIFDLDANGMPTNNIIYSELMVETTVMEWCEHVFTIPVIAPNGFYMALSRPLGSYLSLGYSHPTLEWPFQPNTHFYCLDYLTFNLMAILATGYNCNFMLRAEGYSLGKAVQFGPPLTTSVAIAKETSEIQPVFIPSEPFVTDGPESRMGENSKSLLHYMVYRLMEGQQEDESLWTTLSENVSGLSYSDNGWNALDEGVYRWAVKAAYTSDNLSIPRFTNELIKGMVYHYSVYLSTNSGDPVIGAVVKLTNHDGNPQHVYLETTTGTSVSFSDVWKGTYDITVTLKGFHPYTATNIVIDGQGLSHNAELIEILDPATKALAEAVGEDVKISWREPTPEINKWINHCVNDEIAGRLGWREDEGNDMTAAIRFTPSDLVALEIVSGHFITKVAIGVGTEMNAVTTMELQIWEGGTSVSNPGTLIYQQPITNFTSFTENAMNEVALTTPFIIDATKELRIGYKIVNQRGFPFGRDRGPYVNGKGDLLYCSDLGGWVECHTLLASQNYIYNFSIKAWISSDDSKLLLSSEGGKSKNGYSIYRLAQGAPETEWNLIADNVMELIYLDTDWNSVSAGMYQWAIKANYSSGQSEACITNVLQKEVGISEYDFTNIRLYPNPFTDKIYISQPDLVQSVQITDMIGQQIKNVIFNGKSILVSELSNGIYFVTLESFTGEKLIQKVVKK